MKKEIIAPIITSILFAEVAFVVYENDFMNNSLEGLTVTEKGAATIVAENGELRINPGSSFMDRGVVAINLEEESTKYRSKLLENKGTLIYSFNVRNMDGGLNNLYKVGIWSSTDTSDPKSFGYILSGGGYVGDQFRFSALALAGSKFGPVLDDLVVESDGLQPSIETGAFRIEYTPTLEEWKVYYEASTEVIDPLTVTELVGSIVDNRFTNEELKYLTLTSQTTGAAFFDNINVSIKED